MQIYIAFTRETPIASQDVLLSQYFTHKKRVYICIYHSLIKIFFSCCSFVEILGISCLLYKGFELFCTVIQPANKLFLCPWKQHTRYSDIAKNELFLPPKNMNWISIGTIYASRNDRVMYATLVTWEKERGEASAAEAMGMCPRGTWCLRHVYKHAIQWPTQCNDVSRSR